MNAQRNLKLELIKYKFETPHKEPKKHLLRERWRRNWSQYSEPMVKEM